MRAITKIGRRSAMALAIAGAFTLAAPLAEARITKVFIESQTSAFGGYARPGVGS
jgi:hypothetical protein